MSKAWGRCMAHLGTLSAMPGTSGMPGGQPGPQGGSELGPGPYRRVRRQRTDVAWTVGWALLLLLTFVWGVALAARRNPDYARLINDSSFAQSPASCPAGGRRSLAAAKAEVTPDDFFRLAAGLLAASLAVGLAVGWLVIVGYSRDGVRMTRIAIGIKVALPIALGVLFLITGPVGSGVFLLIVGLAIAGLFWCIRERLAYVGQLLTVSSKGLRANWAIVPFAVALNVALAAFLVPLIALLYGAAQNGQVVRASGVSVQLGRCVDASGAQVDCCAWQPSSAASVYFFFASLAFLWTVMNFYQIRIFTIGGTIAQWYFAPAEQTDLRGNLMRSLGHALGPQFGSICMGGAIMVVVQQLRQAARRQRNNGICGFLAACILSCMADLIEYLTKFATLMSAISGERFVEAGRSAIELLKRNALDAFTVWWLPGVVVSMLSLVLSLCWACVCAAIAWFSWHRRSSPGGPIFAVALVCFLLTLAIMDGLGRVLLNCLDAVFLCYAIDRDTSQVSNAEVHDVFAKNPGIFVAQPVAPVRATQPGPIMYGSPVAPGYGAPVYGTPQLPHAAAQPHSQYAYRPEGAEGASAPAQPGYGGYEPPKPSGQGHGLPTV